MAGRTKPTDLWNVDIADGRLRLAHVTIARRQPRVTHAISVPLEPDTTDEQAVELLQRALGGSGIDTEYAAVCLPTTAGYLRCRDAGAPVDTPADESFVTESWSVDDDGRELEITAVADRREADRLISIAKAAGLHVVHVALSQVAAAAALGMLGADARNDVRAGFVVDHGQVRFALSRRGAVVLTRSSPRDDGADAGRIAGAIYRAAQMAEGGQIPAEVSVIAGDDDFAAIESIAPSLGVSLQRIRPGLDREGGAESPAPHDTSEYAILVGASLLAAGLTDRKTDLRGALTQPDQHRPSVRRRFWGALTAMILLGSLGLFAAKWIPKQMELTRLRHQYESSQPLLQRQVDAQRTWRLLRPWMSASQDGERIGHLQILRDITEMFPESADAYVTDMNVNVGRIGEPVDISITGRVVTSDILYACIGRLNDSGRFDAQSIRLSDVEQALAYPKRYVIPITMKGAGDE